MSNTQNSQYCKKQNGGSILNVRAIERWLQKFCSGDKSFENGTKKKLKYGQLLIKLLIISLRVTWKEKL